MKRLLRIGSGLFICSIFPTFTWIALSFILGDSRILNVFSITYAIQYCYGILVYFFATGANIRKEKENTPNAIWSGIFWGIIISVIIFAIPLIFVDGYINFFGLDAEFYRVYVMYSIVLIFLQTLLAFIVEKLYFEYREKLANKLLIFFNVLNLVLVIFLVWLIQITAIALGVTLAVLFVYVICLYIWQFEKFKIDFSFFKNFKYESADIVCSAFNLIIYLFGFQTAFSFGQEYVVAINLVTLCTDPFWDALYSIEKVAKVDISKGCYAYRKELKNAHLYTLILVLLSVSMTVGGYFFVDTSFQIVMIVLLMQIVSLFLGPIQLIMAVFVQLDYSPKLNTAIILAGRGVRTVLGIFLYTAYCTEIAHLVSAILIFTTMLVIRYKKFRVEEDRLVFSDRTSENIIRKVLKTDLK